MLQEALVTVSKLLAPFTPFVADEIYDNLDGSEPSVHLCDFPEPGARDEGLVRALTSKFEDVMVVLLLPLYLATVGLVVEPGRVVAEAAADRRTAPGEDAARPGAGVERRGAHAPLGVAAPERCAGGPGLGSRAKFTRDLACMDT